MKLLKKILLYTILTAAALSFIYPFIWMIMASLSPEHDINSLILFPSEFTIENYQSMISKIPIGRALFNSTFVATINTGFSLIFSSMVGYALSRME
ncbi:MAG: carbohydrate ABC transporter permease, partial [Bacteroidales bacterium]|nr:carbohydrate ABC transporter permease [Bacteroidales bacterium]